MTIHSGEICTQSKSGVDLPKEKQPHSLVYARLFSQKLPSLVTPSINSTGGSNGGSLINIDKVPPTTAILTTRSSRAALSSD